MPNPAGLRRAALCALLVISLVLNTTGVYWAMPNTNAWHGDDMCHYTLHALADRFSHFTTYPLVHHLTLAVVYSPYLGWLYLRGELDPTAESLESVFASPVAAMTVLIVLGRVVNIAMATATVWLLYRSVERLSGSWIGAFVAACVYAFSNATVLYVKILGVDTPMMFWFALTFSAYLQFVESFAPRTGLWLGMLIAISVSTKEQIGGSYVLLVAVVLAMYLRRRRDAERHATEPPATRGLWLMIVGVVATYAILSRLVLDPVGWITRMRWWFGEGTDPSMWGGFPNTIAGQLELLAETGARLATSMGIPLLALSAAAACFALARSGGRAWRVALPLISYYVFLIAIIRYTGTRFMLPVIFLLAALTGVAVAHPFFRRRAPAVAALVAVVAVFSWSVHRCVKSNALMAKDPRYRAEAYLAAQLPARVRVEVYDDDHYLPRIEQLGFVRDFERDHMRQDEFLRRRPEAVVLVPGCWWKFTTKQRRFVAWLRTSSGYSECVLDPDPESSFLADDDLRLIQPAIIILRRPG